MKRALRSFLLGLAARLPRDGAVNSQAPGGNFCVAGPVTAPDWLLEHRRDLCAFLATPGGQTLLARAAAVQANTAIAACNDPLSTTVQPARAAGFGDCLAWLISLSRTSRAPDESGSDKTEQADDRHRNDTPSIGESGLRERMSP